MVGPQFAKRGMRDSYLPSYLKNQVSVEVDVDVEVKVDSGDGFSVRGDVTSGCPGGQVFMIQCHLYRNSYTLSVCHHRMHSENQSQDDNDREIPCTQSCFLFGTCAREELSLTCISVRSQNAQLKRWV